MSFTRVRACPTRLLQGKRNYRKQVYFANLLHRTVQDVRTLWKAGVSFQAVGGGIGAFARWPLRVDDDAIPGFTSDIIPFSKVHTARVPPHTPCRHTPHACQHTPCRHTHLCPCVTLPGRRGTVRGGPDTATVCLGRQRAGEEGTCALLLFV